MRSALKEITTCFGSWMGYEALELLRETMWERKTESLLEFGCGVSTVCWDELVVATELPKRAVSYEHDPTWVASIRPHLKVVELRHRELREDGWYNLTEDEPGEQFDFVIVDGPDGDARGLAYAELVTRQVLKPGTVLFVHDSEFKEGRFGKQLQEVLVTARLIKAGQDHHRFFELYEVD